MTTLLRFTIPRSKVPGVFALMEDDRTPTCELRIKKPDAGVREVEITTDEANADYFHIALEGRG